MEINITAFFRDADHFEYSHSIAEGGPNAAENTWHASLHSEFTLLNSYDEREEARDWFGTFGAWDDEEQAAWTETELNALLVQWIAGDIREAESLCTDEETGEINWEAYEELQHLGTVSANMFKGVDGEIYYTIGS